MSTPDVIVELEHDGTVGYGEASLPPYLGETYESVEAFLSAVDLQQYDSPADVARILADIDAVAPGAAPAKAAIDIALHDWNGKRANVACHRSWGIDPSRMPPTSFTIGIGERQSVGEAAREAVGFRALKLKLGGADDRGAVEAVRSVTDVPLRVDVNQGWSDREDALAMIDWLAGHGVELVEQPLPKEQTEDLRWLFERSPIPVIGDEGVRRFADVERAVGVYHGINIKLMKCTGLAEARRMIARARELGLKVMIGCMTETSCAISAAAQIAPLADWVDLDGALLIGNDPFEGVRVADGQLVLMDAPGIGVVLRGWGESR